jgi:chromate transporter
MTLEGLFVTALIANVIGFGGLSSLPIMRGQLQAAGLPADAILLRSLAIANITPGPNGLYIVVAGYFIAGLKGAAVAILAISLPPLLVLPLEQTHGRLIHIGRFRSAMFALRLSVIALFAISAGLLAQHAGTDPLGIAMVVLGAVLLLMRAPPILGFALAVAAGLLW